MNLPLWLLVLTSLARSDKSADMRRLAVSVTNTSALSLLAIRSPQVCLAGYYCAGRAGSSYGTGPCPLGAFCGPGSTNPAGAPQGTFVATSGAVRVYNCSSGYFSPRDGLATCLPCPPGYSCASQGTVIPNMCQPGTFREAGSASSISCSSCPGGTFSPWRGMPDQTSCEPCPQGRLCLSKTTNVTESLPCQEGYMCGEATSLVTSSAHQCLNGYYCGTQTNPTSVYNNLCPVSFVCAVGTSFANRFRLRCPLGFYCPEGSPWKASMGYGPMAPLVMASRGQFYLLQIASQYCLRQIQAEEYYTIKAQNEYLTAAGLPAVSPNQQSVRLAQWTFNVTSCVLAQTPHLGLVSRSATPLSPFVLEHAAWHASKLLHLVPNLRGDVYTNKCITDKFPRVDNGTTWECLCTANRTNGSLLECLTGTNLGAPFDYEGGYPIDSTTGNCDVDWPNCFDWARLGYYSGSGDVTKETGPSTGAAVDDFDSLGVDLIDYIAQALSHTFLLFASEDGTSMTACPFGTMAATDGLSSVFACQKRFLVTSLNDPDDIVVYRVNPISQTLSNTVPRAGYPHTAEEDLRLVFRMHARDFATITIDVRDLPDEVEYGRDWRVAVLTGDSLDPDSNDVQVCRDIWSKFLSEHTSTTPNPTAMTPSDREELLREETCSWTRNPLAFDAFQLATGSTCPDETQDICYFSTLTSSDALVACNPARTVVKVHELYVHALVDLDLRVEIQIVNGLYAADRFKFIQAVSVDIRSPSRASTGTSDAFVIEFSATEAQVVTYPYNAPILEANPTGATPSGFVDGVAAASQNGVLTRNFLSWLPRDSKVGLSNCMRHTDKWTGEYLLNSGEYFQSRTTNIQTHLPFFSNCRGYGSAIPLWHLVESSHDAGCNLVPVNETVALSVSSFKGVSVGDTCNIQLECMVDEVPNNKQAISRWFEAPAGTQLFRISYAPLSIDTYASISALDQSSSVPVIIRSGARTDGTSFTSVLLKLRYWQKSATDKLLTTADVVFDDFEYLSDDQSKGRAAWNYTLHVSWEPMTHIEVFNSFGFPSTFYAIFSAVIGVLMLAIATVHWGFHWILLPGQVLYSELLDKRYYTLIFPPLLSGISLALIPVTISLCLIFIVFIGETSLFTASLYACDSTDPLGCRVSVLDSLPSSWAGESMTSPNSYSARRSGRTAIVLLVLGGYLVMVTMRAFIPNLVSRYYDKDEGSSKEEKAEEEEDRTWPPDQQIFAPLVYKRSAWFFVIAMSCVVCNLILEFSYSTYFMSLWWIFTVSVLVIGKAVSWFCVNLLNEESLKIPIAVLFETVTHIVTLGSPDFYSFALTAFIVQAAILVDGIYLTPLQQAILRATNRAITKLTRFVRKILKGGIVETEERVRSRAIGEALRSREAADGMMLYLSSFASGVIASILAPMAMLLLSLLYTPTQSFNVYNVSESQATYYWSFQAGILVFRLLVALVALNTAENFHEWKILDYLEYCRYRFVNRVERWKGTNEIADESITPYLRSLDLNVFSSQFYFAQFQMSVGIVLLLLGMQVAINNAWNVFDDQATLFVITGGVVILSVIRRGLHVIADYLKLWNVDQRSMGDGSATDDAGAEIAELFKRDDDEDDVFKIKPPTSSTLYSWPKPRKGDRIGWERYRLAYLRENQLWLQAHMDSLIDGPTTVEFRRLLMDSLANVLKESNILKLSSGQDPTLELNTLPPHQAVVQELQDEVNLVRGSPTEMAALTWITRARFIRFLKFAVADMELEQATELKPFCEACGSRGMFVVPQYPVHYVAEQFRIQRDMSRIWNVPMWQKFFAAFTPGCTLCEPCAIRFSERDVPIGPEDLRERQLMDLPMPCEHVLQESPFALPDRPLSDTTMMSLSHLFGWADTLSVHPESALTAFDESDITDATRRVAQEWLRRVRQRLRI